MKTKNLDKIILLNSFICIIFALSLVFHFNDTFTNQSKQLIETRDKAIVLLDDFEKTVSKLEEEKSVFKQFDQDTNIQVAYACGDLSINSEDFVNDAASIYNFSIIGDNIIKQKTDAYQAELRRQRVANERATRGSLGRLSIPSVGIDVAVFGGMSQGIVDAADSAALFGLHGGAILGDHNYQGFGRIRNMRVGSYAYFEDGNTKTRYVCTGKITNGTNTKRDLVNASGQCVCGGAPGGYVLYTCNDWSGRSITVVFLQPG